MYTALAIITDNNKVLVGKIKPEKINDYGGIEYAFPNGQTNDKESIKQTLIEEVKMQTNLDVTIITKIGERVHPITNNLTEYFHCKKVYNQTLKVSKKADMETFIWIAIEEIKNYMPSLFEEVKDYLEKSKLT
jgi:8-oxo-dGTP diphosphatase